MLNNLTQKTIDDKTKDISGLLDQDNIRSWFSKVLTIRRAPHEQSQHQQYMILLNKLNKKLLFKTLIKDAYQVLTKIL